MFDSQGALQRVQAVRREHMPALRVHFTLAAIGIVKPTLPQPSAGAAVEAHVWTQVLLTHKSVYLARTSRSSAAKVIITCLYNWCGIC